ncbi:MAG: ACP S-malonyltransferase, partial [Thermoanaerobaculia bacterium]
TAFVFPGQGSQQVGMGRAWVEGFAAARATFEEADETLGFALSTLCFDGPEDELQLTANTQPAILATSVAIWRVVRERSGVEPALVAGHSLGEYTAHVAAGTLTLADALRLVRRRGELMQEAVPVGVGAMAAILGLDAAAVAAVAEEASRNGEVCAVANYNAPTQIVVAGHAPAVERAMTLAGEAGARRAIPLPVSAPFHSPLMAPAREGLTPDLASVSFADPDPPVVVNIDARPVDDGAGARDALVRQIDGPVRWVESVEWMASEGGIERFIEVGPGSVLRGLVRKIVAGATTAGIAEPSDLEALDASAER